MCENKLGQPAYLIILLSLLCNVSHPGFETVDASTCALGICVMGLFVFLKYI